jgi:hypothetical protein
VRTSDQFTCKLRVYVVSPVYIVHYIVRASTEHRQHFLAYTMRPSWLHQAAEIKYAGMLNSMAGLIREPHQSNQSNETIDLLCVACHVREMPLVQLLMPTASTDVNVFSLRNCVVPEVSLAFVRR